MKEPVDGSGTARRPCDKREFRNMEKKAQHECLNFASCPGRASEGDYGADFRRTGHE
jgi:hypothetical protein